MKSELEAFERLSSILDELRQKCPWDKKQTIDSLRYLTIEEVYELSDAILEQQYDEVKKELGDILMHIFFYSKIAQDEKRFNLTDVLNAICEKLIRRHPHIYGDVEAQDAEAVKQNWEKIKMTEGRTSVLSGVPNSLPAMVKAVRMQEKARGIGFDWDNADQVKEKVLEEYNELQVELSKDDNHDGVEAEFGDLLFALINWSRFIGVNPEDALERTNKKFKARFQYMEQKSKETGCQLSDMTLDEMDVWWNEAKKQLKD
ncbi:MAG: nucleoside triphosphate pyrophosphohydrolase [Bacteroidales bacterium]|nr:nucleoside triphosphate pyrophosphohydrolase [Bacteroidales bacterium]